MTSNRVANRPKHDPYDKTPVSVYDANGRVPTNFIDLVTALKEAGRGAYIGTNKDGEPCFAKDDESILVMGGSRMGKTSGFYVPSIATFPGPVVAVSKRASDIRDHSIEGRRQQAGHFGGQVVEFDPYDGVQLRRALRLVWDTTVTAQHWPTAFAQGRLLATVAVGQNVPDKHWGKKGGNLIGALNYAGSLIGHNAMKVASELDDGNFKLYEQVMQLAANGRNPSVYFGGDETTAEHDLEEALALPPLEDEERELSSQGRPLAPQAWSTYQSVMKQGAAANAERSSIRSAATGINDYMRMAYDSGPLVPAPPSAHEEPDDEPVDLIELLSTHSAIFITVDKDPELMAPIVAAFVDVLQRYWEGLRPWRELEGSKAVRALFFAIDEAANLCPLPQLQTLMSAGGGDGIQVAPAFQAPHQAVSAYGSEGEAIIRVAVHRLIYPGIRDSKFVQEVAEEGVATLRHSDMFVNGKTPYERRGAPEQYLLEERHRFEAMKTVGLSRGFPPAEVDFVAGRRLLELRIQAGYGIREKYLANGEVGVPALLAELHDLTAYAPKVRQSFEVEAWEIKNPPKGMIFRDSAGSRKGFVGMKHFRADPFWRMIFEGIDRNAAQKRSGPKAEATASDGTVELREDADAVATKLEPRKARSSRQPTAPKVAGARRSARGENVGPPFN